MGLLLNNNKINCVSNEKICDLEKDIKTAIEKTLHVNVNYFIRK